MIEITIRTDKKGICNGLIINGHAGYDEYGKDIICAAVSVLVINTINSIETFTDDKFTVRNDEETGTIELNMISDISRESRLLIDSLLLGLQGIEEQYGGQYIKFS
ncbi:ribosomal-processing cysteine protease Prp [Velocimicrobium porci]|uniref:Ribosomal processing cysteine protease Prp n=1 Tax=Velocimicrobium porci TaxID=2606634 RepID=A0A6L5Y0Y8_9FIRM|nr:ribosomal-processing cysteine protease Prp [Velocimicrobium porci]MSS64351.1 ribosomal-processing cysteine protease Prp [Velocimicrobium porci]